MHIHVSEEVSLILDRFTTDATLELAAILDTGILSIECLLRPVTWRNQFLIMELTRCVS